MHGVGFSIEGSTDGIGRPPHFKCVVSHNVGSPRLPLPGGVFIVSARYEGMMH
jgi:hypothetical protein